MRIIFKTTFLLVCLIGLSHCRKNGGGPLGPGVGGCEPAPIARGSGPGSSGALGEFRREVDPEPGRFGSSGAIDPSDEANQAAPVGSEEETEIPIGPGSVVPAPAGR